MRPERGFQPTYEGLKLRVLRPGCEQYSRFQPTYEGLKPIAKVALAKGIPSFQPTYEGLKLVSRGRPGPECYGFPAYLRGIETDPPAAGAGGGPGVSSLPTRD